MANKRMFTMKICDSDAFLDMPLSSQCLYFHLNMRADDDGFIDNPKRIMKIVGASEDDLKVLLAKNFLLTFESGVIVVKHWRMHNTLGKQRYHETQYIEEKSQLLLKENGSYSFTDGIALNDERVKALFERRTSGEQVENADIDIDIDIDLDKGLDKDLDLDLDKDREKNIYDYQKIVESFHTTCSSLPTIRQLTDKRKLKIKQRLKKFSEAEILEAFAKVEESDFCTGRTGDWQASFDWIFASDNNLIKILEGNYDNKVKQGKPAAPKATQSLEDIMNL